MDCVLTVFLSRDCLHVANAPPRSHDSSRSQAVSALFTSVIRFVTIEIARWICCLDGVSPRAVASYYFKPVNLTGNAAIIHRTSDTSSHQRAGWPTLRSMSGRIAYGSPPTAGSAHWTIPRVPKSSIRWSSYPISRRRGLVCWPIWLEVR